MLSPELEFFFEIFSRTSSDCKYSLRPVDYDARKKNLKFESRGGVREGVKVFGIRISSEFMFD